jgi:hypothetical protein
VVVPQFQVGGYASVACWWLCCRFRLAVTLQSLVRGYAAPPSWWRIQMNLLISSQPGEIFSDWLHRSAFALQRKSITLVPAQDYYSPLRRHILSSVSATNHNTMSLCFLEAFNQKKNGSITEDEYLQHLLAHCQGVEHQYDESKPWDEPMVELKNADLFGYSIWLWSRKMDSIDGNKALNLRSRSSANSANLPRYQTPS